jgi:thiamine-phosphate pyrophosphorylase
MKSNARFALSGLYAITPAMADTDALLERVALALDGGAALVQYRAKDFQPALALEQARRLVALCRAHRVPLIVNDSVELALAAGADGVHVGRDDAAPAVARAALPHGIVGVSCYATPEAARVAAQAGADYVGIGSVFASATKPGAVRAPLDDIARARRAGGLPVAAIGGITAANVAQVAAAGAAMAAVISALFDAPDVAGAARALSQPFRAAARRSHG